MLPGVLERRLKNAAYYAIRANERVKHGDMEHRSWQAILRNDSDHDKATHRLRKLRKDMAT